MKVTIKTFESECSNYARLDVYVGDAYVGGGGYGGEPEDNFRCRTYYWVEQLVAQLSKQLGADVECIELTED